MKPIVRIPMRVLVVFRASNHFARTDGQGAGAPMMRSQICAAVRQVLLQPEQKEAAT
jgi:hypothetical protein